MYAQHPQYVLLTSNARVRWVLVNAAPCPGHRALHTMAGAVAPHPRVGVGVILLRGDTGCALVGRRKGSLGAGEWALPGGHLEHGETFEACAQREVLEETGIDLSSSRPRFATVQNVLFPGGQHYVTIFMQATVAQDAEARLLEPDKCACWCWVEWDRLSTQAPLFQPLRQLVDAGYVPR